MRLDKEMVARGLVQSRGRAHALIADGAVMVGGAIARKPATDVSASDQIEIVGEDHPWVSRAALKLVHGLDTFGIDVTGATALDLGASTGGFSQVLLARGVAKIFAVDVGHGQLHPDLSEQDKVVNMEGVNGRDLSDHDIPELDLIVTDVSFISLTKVLPAPLGFVAPGGQLVALIKPQFEVGRGAVGKGGIVRDAAAREAARANVRAFLTDLGWDVLGEAESPITGSDGNQEYLIWARKSL